MNTKRTLISIVVSAALAGCSSGTTDTSDTTVGVITGFGSVYVNGVEYETNGTSFDIDEANGSENDLAVGQVVTLKGSVNADGATGTATNISFADNVEGVVIAAIIAADGTGTLDVMGQTVTVTATTMFDTDVVSIADMASISAGNLVEVSGYSMGDGNIVATHIEVKAAAFSGQEMEVKGLVSSLDSGAKTFNIGSLVVEYGSAIMDLEGKTLVNGLYVEAKTVTALAGYIMTASRVEIEDDGDMDMDMAEGEEIEMSGPVLAKGADYIVINGQRFYFTGILDDDSDIAFADITVGMYIEVEAYADSQGRLIVTEAELEDEGDISITAHIDANGINLTNKTITILGQTVKVSNSTVFKDEQDEGVTPVRYFHIDDLAAGDLIELEFYVDTDGSIIATLVEREDDTMSASSFILEAKLEAVDASSFTLGGITFNEDLSAYVTPAVGEDLKVMGSYVNGVFTITSVTA